MPLGSWNVMSKECLDEELVVTAPVVAFVEMSEKPFFDRTTPVNVV